MQDSERPARLRQGYGGSAEAPTSEPGTRNPEPGTNSLIEIIFTSGATAEPKGVTITHRNVLANIVPIEREIDEVPAGTCGRSIRFDF